MKGKAQAELISDFSHCVTRLGVDLDPGQMASLAEFCSLIAAYSEHTNLVGNADLAVLLYEHVLDSLTLLPIISEYRAHAPVSLLDIGTGAGFPAIVLALAAP